MWRRGILLGLLAIIVLPLLYQFAPPGDWPALPLGYRGRTAAWVSVEWSLEAHTRDEIDAAFAPHRIDDLWIYQRSAVKPLVLTMGI